MSRGLGTRQRLILAALSRLEQMHGEGRFYVWSVLGAAADLGLRAEQQSKDAERDAASSAYRAELSKRAAAGDEAAVSALGLERKLDVLATAIKRNPRRSDRQRRPPEAWAEDINPSRIFALLERRGLIVRNPALGPGATVGLTAAGRLEVGGVG